MSYGLSDRLRSLRARLTIWNSIVVFVVGLFALLAVRQGLYFALLHEADIVLREEAEEILLTIKQTYPDRAAILSELRRKTIVHEQEGWFVQLRDAPAHTVWTSPSTPQELLDRPFVSTERGRGTTSGSYRLVELSLEQPDMPTFLVRVGTATRFIDDDVQQVTRIAAPVGLLLLLLAPLGGYVLSGRATQPLQEIISTTAKLRPDRMTDRLKIRGTHDELDQLSQKINAFLDEISRHLDEHRDFIANAAHELRSPLTALQSSIDVTLGQLRSPAEYELLLGTLSEQCESLTTTVNQLLLLAENAPNRRGLIERRTVDLSDLVRRSVEMFSGVAEERGIDLQALIDASVVLRGETDGLRQVINNLLDNALKFTPTAGRIVVSLRTHPSDNCIELVVSDSGKGIPQDEQERVFERFYQVDRSHQRQSGRRGSGLGLSICRAIIDNHGGTISVRSEVGNGSEFHVRLPLVDGPTGTNCYAVPTTA